MIKIQDNSKAEASNRLLHAWGAPMPTLFRVCCVERQWRVLVNDQTYGDYLDKANAVADAIDAAGEVRAAGRAVEVWEGPARVY
jgi:hypothetical protein